MKKPADPTYEDLIAIVRLIESGSRFTDFRLRSGDIEVEVHRGNGAAAPSPSLSPAADPARAAFAELPAGTHIVRSPMPDS